MTRMFVFTNSLSVSIFFNLFCQSLVFISFTIFLNSSITKGSMGLETRLLVFLKAPVEVEEKPKEPLAGIPVVFIC